LNLYDGKNNLFLSPLELRKALRQEQVRVRQEKLKAEQEKTRAEQEKSRAERLAAQLKALGIDPME
jgi:uncharacterized protein (DUF3084 family)